MSFRSCAARHIRQTRNLCTPGTVCHYHPQTTQCVVYRSHSLPLQQLTEALCQLQASCVTFPHRLASATTASLQQTNGSTDVSGSGSSSSSSKDAHRIYVKRVGTAPYAEALMLGLLNHFKRLYPNVGFFKPVGTDMQAGVPRNVRLMHSAFDMQDSMESMFAIDERSAYQVRRLSLWYVSILIIISICAHGLLLAGTKPVRSSGEPTAQAA